ncbi:MAG: CoA transferase [Dehalococcoidia bacterium]
MAKPLDGIRVFDLTLAGVGPWAGKLLGELGADVIHVESPQGRPFGVPPMYGGVSILYVTANTNKRCVVLDLKDPKDRQAAYELLQSCDVFLENMRPGVVERLGLDYESVAKINPQLVYLSASGYGQTGPMVPRPGADPQLQAFSGWNSITGEEDGDLQFFRHFAHLDYNTSQYIVMSLLMALYARTRTGKGQKIEVAMLAAAMSLQSTRFAEFFATGKTPPRLGSATTSTAPHQAFLCQDQRYLTVGVVREEQWPALCSAIGRDDLAQDERFDTHRLRIEHRKALTAVLDEVFVTKPLRWWEINLTKAGVPHGRILSFHELRYHPQVVENDSMRLTPTDHWGPIYHEGAPWQFSKSDHIEWKSAPRIGEHTYEVLQELGLARQAPEPAPAHAGE